jgi:hypothetical protein
MRLSSRTNRSGHVPRRTPNRPIEDLSTEPAIGELVDTGTLNSERSDFQRRCTMGNRFRIRSHITDRGVIHVEVERELETVTDGRLTNGLELLLPPSRLAAAKQSSSRIRSIRRSRWGRRPFPGNHSVDLWVVWSSCSR